MYPETCKSFVAIDCIIFGFDGEDVKLLLIHRGFEPLKDQWSLMGGFIEEMESPDEAAIRVLKKLTGLEDVYMEQMDVFGNPNRDPYGKTISICYFALIDIQKYKHQIINDYRAAWFSLKEVPELILDHNDMVASARNRLKYKAALHPILFELLPDKFTIPQIVSLYEGVYDIILDKRNFNRKLLSTKLLVKTSEKDKLNSKKGAYYFKLNSDVYKEKFSAFINFIPNPN
ncbi:NUDIX hydrolase [Sphingobacterium alkalisoli]|uniref:NUDIX hydrolase n=1 Tax=Sphingobacterium alkalisoli TaxID=1874115 RepID=A0A4U0H2C8_9SPHI|nr:NUDIX domain-containing protein [Sphingobacterium alkalisoli]TJY65618.1 NUDIX hydrolase [Sphingobacterium alkalisoli]GGH19385.1 DNA mismatch repair protein MutT [Sphingobacterium alkalisoli]